MKMRRMVKMVKKMKMMRMRESLSGRRDESEAGEREGEP